MYKLTKIAIRAIQQQAPVIYSKLAEALHCSEGTIKRYINTNNDNLTKPAVIDVIWLYTGLKRDEILEKMPRTCQYK